MVEDGRTGILVDPGQATALWKAMEDLDGSPARRAAMGRAGRERFESSFGVRRYVERFSDVYEGIIEEG